MLLAVHEMRNLLAQLGSDVYRAVGEVFDDARALVEGTTPIAIVAVEQDSLFPDEIREKGVKALVEKKLEHELTVYLGVPHGFAVLGDYEDGKIVEEQKKAFHQMLAWLKGH